MKKKTKDPETFLNWCYINDKKAVMMVMDTDTFQLIKDTLTKYQELKAREFLHESDEHNYGYTRRDTK